MPSSSHLSVFGVHEENRMTILPRNQFRDCAVLIPFVLVQGEEHLLFEKRAPNIRQGGEICFPGGRVEEDDSSAAAAAVRETVEELGVAEENEVVRSRLGTLVSHSGVLVEAYVGEIRNVEVESLALNRGEVETVFTVPVAALAAMEPESYQVRVELQPRFTDAQGREVVLLPSEELGLPKRYRAPWEGRRSRVLVYRMSEHTVWGITAELVNELLRRIASGGKELF